MERLIDIKTLNKVSILGMGKSGLEVAGFFSKHGINVFISDAADEKKVAPAIEKLKAMGAEYETGGHTDKVLEGTDLAVISPGISFEAPVVKKIREKGISVISELELAFRLSKAPFIAITGTNGKSTTTTMIGDFLAAGGLDVIVGGNIGIPLVEKAYNAKEDQFIVAEVSSFQLETVEYFRPYISLILNITSDHLDRHGTMENYLNFKSRIFKCQNEGSYVILNYDNELIKSLENKIKAEVLFFSATKKLKKGIYAENGAIYYHNNEICKTADIPLPGKHNLENTLAAILASFLCNIPKDAIIKGLREFKGLRHRMEFVDNIKGVTFIDDSKGTNPDAVIAALNSYKEPIILISGGVDKNMDFTELSEVIAKRVKSLVLIGTTADMLEKKCRNAGLNDIKRAGSMDEAVREAFERGKPGDTVLLSPAGASFDMFKNAEDRGEKFILTVKNLKSEIESK